MIERSLPAGSDHVVRVRCSERSDGDFAIDGDVGSLARARSRLAPGRWTWLTQTHGANVVLVDTLGARCGAKADASVTNCVGAVLSVQSADCAPVVFVSEASVAVAHAGWRGIVGGVILATLKVLRSVGGHEVDVLLGPCIAPANYQFGIADLDLVASVAGDSVRATTTDGFPALDIGAAVLAQCKQAGVSSFSVIGPSNNGNDHAAPFDTADKRWYSSRMRAEAQRQATVAWLERR